MKTILYYVGFIVALIGTIILSLIGIYHSTLGDAFWIVFSLVYIIDLIFFVCSIFIRGISVCSIFTNVLRITLLILMYSVILSYHFFKPHVNTLLMITCALAIVNSITSSIIRKKL